MPTSFASHWVKPYKCKFNVRCGNIFIALMDPLFHLQICTNSVMNVLLLLCEEIKTNLVIHVTKFTIHIP